MEARIGHDFGHVRIHSGDRAAASSAALGAFAYTLGSHVVFGAGAYNPSSLGGRWLLAHELTHVAQQAPRQRAGSKPPLTSGGLRIARAEPPAGTFLATPADMSNLEDFMLRLFELLDTSTRNTLIRNKTIAIALLRDEDGVQFLGYTVNGNWTNPQLEAAAQQLGLERLNPRGRAEGRGAVGAPQDAEQLLIDFAETTDSDIGGAAVSRIVCPDCLEAIAAHEPAPFPVVEVTIPAAPAPSATGAAEPATDFEFPVDTRFRVLSTEQIPGDRVASEIEATFGDGLDAVNESIVAQGGKPLPPSVVIRVTTDAAGEFVAAESTTGEASALVEMLARQALASVPEAAEGAAAGAMGGTAGAVSPWVRGLGWAGLVIFAGVTAYQVATAPPEERPHVLVKAGGGFVGGMAGSYVVCNLVLGIETLGWSLLICGALVGIPAGMAGQAIADVAYEEATIDDDEIRAWVASHDDATIGALTVQEKLRMIFSLMKGWISDDDVAAIVHILNTVGTTAEMNRIRAQLEPKVASEMNSIGQRTEVRLALARL